MVQIYAIHFNNEKMGNAKVKKEGLYYRISCECDLPDNAVYKIFVSCGENTVDLGVCTPRGGYFGIEARIPAKKLGEGDMNFAVVPKNAMRRGCFLTVDENTRFPAIDKLENAHLEIRNRQIGIVISD